MATVAATRQNLTIRDLHPCLYRRDKPRKVAMVVAMYNDDPCPQRRAPGRSRDNQALQPATVPNKATEQQLAD